jgi:hypothetical protein
MFGVVFPDAELWACTILKTIINYVSYLKMLQKFPGNISLNIHAMGYFQQGGVLPHFFVTCSELPGHYNPLPVDQQGWPSGLSAHRMMDRLSQYIK